MIKTQQIQNVKSFAVNADQVKLNSAHEVFDCNQHVNLKSEISLQEIKFEEPFFYISDIEGNSYLLKDSIHYLENAVVKKVLDVENILVSKNNATEIYNLYSRTFTNVFDFRIFRYYLFGDFIFVSRNDSVYAFVLYSSNPHWQFNLSTLGTYYDSFQKLDKPYQVSKFLGIWKNELLVALQEHKIIALDINTGEILRAWSTIPDFHFDDVIKANIPRSNSFILFENKLIGAIHKFYVEIDLNTSSINYADITNEMVKNRILSIYPVLDNPLVENQLYLTAKMEGQERGSTWSYDCLFSLNIQTKKIDWKHTFENSALGVNRPQCSNDKLYQLDNDHTLHIFQRQ